MRDEIRWEGNSEDIVFKSPIVDFCTGSSVIVHESQNAIFYLNGECYEELGPGIHVLETSRLPGVTQFINKITKSEIMYGAEVYFINKTEIANLKWGIGDIVYEEAGYSFPIGARGIYSVKVINSRKIIEKINGTRSSYSKMELEERLRELIGNVINNKIVNTLYNKKISIVHASRFRVEIANDVKQDIDNILLMYGLKLTQFVIERIYVDENNANYKRLQELLLTEGSQERILKLKIQKEKTEAELAAYTREVQGYTYHDERKYDILEAAAANANGGMASEMMQLGAGVGLANSVSGIMKDVVPEHKQ